jgi:murein L,D-transpeptidase YafK
MWGGWRVYGCTVLVAACVALAAGPAWPDPQAEPDNQLTIYVHKRSHEMRLQEGDRLLRRFEIQLGTNPTGTKLVRGDNRTPEGRYYVCEKRPQSKFRRFLGISYPNIEDADRALAQQLINANQWADVFFAHLRNQTPPWSTVMGGWVGIHGYGGRKPVPFDWTKGCIAVSDADIDYLYDRVRLGTPVVIGD